MKKIIVTSLLLACSMILAMPQSFQDRISTYTIGVFGGLNIPRLTGGGGNPLSKGWSSRAGGAAGLTFTWNAGKHLTWCGDVLYSSEGGQRNGMQALDGSTLDPQIPSGTYLYANFKNKSILNYIEVPVMAKYSSWLTRSSRWYLDFGPYIGFLLNAWQKTSGSGIVYADPAGTQVVSVNPDTGEPVPVPFEANTDITNKIHAVNLGFTGGLGIIQRAGYGDVILNVRGAYGLSNIQKNSSDGKNHTGNLLISLGYSIPL